jgi:hypothetical protein
VFPDQFARNPEKALESALTAGGIAEVFEDTLESGLGAGMGANIGNVTLLRAWRNRAGRSGQLGGSADPGEPRVSKTS